MANCDSGPPGARSLYQRQVFGVSSSARSLEKFASMKPTRPSSPARSPRGYRGCRHQPRAVADRDAHAEGLLQRLDFEAFLQRAGDGLFGVDVFAGLRDFARERQMLLVRHREDDAFDRGIAEQGREIGRTANSEVALKRARLSSERLNPRRSRSCRRRAARVRTLAQRPRPTMPTLMRLEP